MLPPAAATTLILALSRIISPNLTEPAFNNWYDNDLLPAFMTHQNATLGLRFKAYAPVTPAAPYTHLALYKTTKDVKIGDLVPSTSAYVPPLATTKRDIGPQDVEIKLSVWKRIHVFESLRSRKNQTEGTVSKIVMAVMLEPRAGKEAEVEVEEWYHKQHLDMLSMLPAYRRCTRYRSADGSAPRWLAVHELESLDLDAYGMETLINTELSVSVMGTAKIFNAVNWGSVSVVKRGEEAERL